MNADPKMELPEVRLWEFADGTGADPTRQVITVKELVHVVGREEAAQLLGIATAAANASSTGGGSAAEPRLRVLDYALAAQPFFLKNW